MNANCATVKGVHSYSAFCGYDERYLHLHLHSKNIPQKVSSYSYDSMGRVTKFANSDGKKFLSTFEYRYDLSGALSEEATIDDCLVVQGARCKIGSVFALKVPHSRIH